MPCTVASRTGTPGAISNSSLLSSFDLQAPANVRNRGSSEEKRNLSGRRSMRRFHTLCMLIAFMLVVAASVSAADKNSGNVTISESVRLGGSQLAPGDYKVSWEGSGPNVQVTLTRGKSSITAPATITDQSSPYGRTAVIVRQDNGSKVLNSIQLSKHLLVFGAEQTQAGR